jgi:predicted MPP superfamily phosphohydrolase
MVSVLVAGAMGASLAFYAYLLEPIWLKTRTVPMGISETQGKTLRIIHVSDFHWGAFVSHRYLTRAFKTIAAQHPDAIFITGDFLNRRIEDRGNYENGLRLLSQAAPTYAVPGNHDGGEWVAPIGGYETTDSIRELLTSAGIHYLENDFDCPELQGIRVCVGGLGDLGAGMSNPGVFVTSYDSATAGLKVMLMHNPDAKASVRDNYWDLMLAGHTHGGQVTIPFVGSPWVDVKDKSQLKGLFLYADRPLHINPGVGSSQRRARLNCRPEVSVLEIRL